MENKLKKLFDYIESKGFSHEINTEVESLFFIKIENDTKKNILISYREFDEGIRLHEAVTSYVEIDKVEDILFAVTNEVRYIKRTISASIGIDKEENFLDDYFWIKKDKDLDDYLEKLDTYYQSHIAPFFEAIPTLQSFNDKVLSVVPFDDYHHYLSGKFGLKAMIIMRLCKNPLYEDYVNYREEDFKTSPDLMNTESRWHKMVKNSYDEFNKFKEMVANGEV